MDAARPYFAAFARAVPLTLQYRTAALAGFATQCWWGAIKIMVLAAFFRRRPRRTSRSAWANASPTPGSAQGFLTFLPWDADPEVAAAVRTGAVSLRSPEAVDAYAWWYARAGGYMTARAAPRALLMFLPRRRPAAGGPRRLGVATAGEPARRRGCSASPCGGGGPVSAIDQLCSM